MKLGTEVGLGSGYIVLDGDPAPLPKNKKGHSPPIFGQFLLCLNGWMHQDATWYGGRPQPRPHCARWEPSSPHKWQETGRCASNLLKPVGAPEVFPILGEAIASHGVICKKYKERGCGIEA